MSMPKAARTATHAMRISLGRMKRSGTPSSMDSPELPRARRARPAPAAACLLAMALTPPRPRGRERAA